MHLTPSSFPARHRPSRRVLSSRVLSSRVLSLPSLVLSPLVLLLACGDERGTSASASAGGTGATTLPPTTGVGTTEQPTTGLTDGGGTMTGGVSASTGGTADTAGSTTDGGGLKFDLGGQPDAPPVSACGDGGGGGGMGNLEFSYIWIANSVEGTVSKIDTEAGVEVGRFVTTPTMEGIGDINNGPSRTSVNLYGDAAVANRNGGVTKIAAREADCIDKNGNGVIDTSTGLADVKAWGEDECVLWHHPTPTDPLAYNEGPRPLAWVGALGPDQCPLKNPPLWVGYYDLAQNLGIFERLNGATGETEETVTIPWSGNNWGPYGGAVNKEGDFFVTGWSSGPAAKIDAVTLEPTVYQPPGFESFYGMALDAKGDVWIAGCDGVINHLDPNTGEFTYVGMGPGCLRGIQVDKQGRAFIAHNGFPAGITVVDTLTKSFINPNVELPGSNVPVGVSIDAEGFVWVVDQGGWAYKVDPDTYETVLVVSGLNFPYTYSDMTGAGLNLVVNPPG